MAALMSLLSIVPLLWVLWRVTRRKVTSRPPLPPGPPGDPFLGNIRILPGDHTETFFHDISKTYGNVASLSIFGRTMIIVNSVKAAVDLLDKRSLNYSDRPDCHTMRIMGWDNNVGFMSYGKHFQEHRRMLNRYLSQVACRSYQVYQQQEAQRLVENLRLSPENFTNHLSRFSAAVILRIIHGQEIASDDSPYIQLMADAAYCNANCALPGSNSVDLFPILQYFPSWFPGTYPATIARNFRPMVEKLYNYPFEDVKRQMAKNTALDSFISRYLGQIQREGDQCAFNADDVKGAAATAYSAGTDTTWATILTFMLAMVLHPAVQAAAQEEIDRVIGDDRLPDFEDRLKLSYLDGVFQESLRWNNAIPSGVPHCSQEDDVYEGMFIPKGSIIIPNTRGMTLDETIYKDPTVFDPSRYLRGEPRPVGQFGFGRRICPGRHLAEASVWIAIASILSEYTITPARDENGEEVLPPLEFVSGLSSHPKYFKCTIVPRRNVKK